MILEPVSVQGNTPINSGSLAGKWAVDKFIWNIDGSSYLRVSLKRREFLCVLNVLAFLFH